MTSTAFFDVNYLGYNFSVTTNIEGLKSVEIRRKADESSIKFYKDIATYSEAENVAMAFIDGLHHKKEMYTCSECGYTASVEEISRRRKPCCNAGRPLC